MSQRVGPSSRPPEERRGGEDWQPGSSRNSRGRTATGRLSARLPPAISTRRPPSCKVRRLLLVNAADFRLRSLLDRSEGLLVALQIAAQCADDPLQVPRAGDDPGRHDPLRGHQVDEVEDELLARMGDAEQVRVPALQLVVRDLYVEACFGLVHRNLLVWLYAACYPIRGGAGLKGPESSAPPTSIRP